MESSRPKEKKKTEEHVTLGNGDRHEKNEQELDGTRKEGPGQSELENVGRRPMFHWELQDLDNFILNHYLVNNKVSTTIDRHYELCNLVDQQSKNCTL
ncbi:unnamed protein product [Schistosoma curassoni]|uniref:LisH domain-containing protein n=1 Tax=Schistosoma curassoni TaxID=6186 RepID=A0A183K8V3_9TREM|nr:unnamed protein product [Schistosoma curassoni]